MNSPTSQDGTGRGHWLRWTLAGIAGAALLGAALWMCIAVLPQRLYPPLSNADLAGLSPADRAERREGRDKLQNDARTTLLQGLGALLVLGGAGITAAVTLRQVHISRQQLKQAREDAERSDKRLGEQIAVAQEGQITERFTRAVDQLGRAGPDRLDVRLGGIYALERIAHDSPTHRLAVIEILTAFVRSHAPWPPRLPDQYAADAPGELPSLQARAPDIQAALTIIGHRPTQKDDPHLDLNETDLRHANLEKANLTGTQLGGANLTGARLGGANLTGARLDKANLTRAWLDKANLTEAEAGGANLTRAVLAGADLTHATLDGADLTDARLSWADLTRARLDKANLTRARLDKANLTRAWLGGANLTAAWLEEVNLTDARLNKANLAERVYLNKANLTRAVLEEANLTGAWLASAKLTKARLYKANLTEAVLAGADLTEAELGKALANRKTIWPDGWDRTRRVAAGVDEPDEETPRAATPPG